MSSEDLSAFLTSVGLADRRVKNICKDPKISLAVRTVLAEAGVVAGATLDAERFDILLEIAHKIGDVDPSLRRFLVDYACAQPLLLHAPQLAEALKVAKRVHFEGKSAGDVDKASFERECGIGIVTTREEISAAIEAILGELGLGRGADGKIDAAAAKSKIGLIWKGLKQRLPWHDSSVAKVPPPFLLTFRCLTAI